MKFPFIIVKRRVFIQHFYKKNLNNSIGKQVIVVGKQNNKVNISFTNEETFLENKPILTI